MEERIQTVSGRDPLTGAPSTTIHKEVIHTSVDEAREHELRNKGNMNLLLGIALGGIIAICAMAYFANEKGSFAVAGAAMDQSVDDAASSAKEGTADAARAVGDTARNAGDAVDDSLTKAADGAKK